MVKALVLLSGGLDSLLAAKLLEKQGIKILGLSFESCFFDAEKAKKSAKSAGIDFRVVDFSEEHLVMVKNPHYGYGAHLNPCIDCHALMIRKAGEIMKKESYDFIATGEVLGQRPMSQNKNALGIVEKFSGLDGYVLRPLSAKLMEETIPEKDGRVDRSKLLDIQGRTRSRQMELVKKINLTDYASPAGGCLLTDEVFSLKLKEMFENWPDCRADDVKLLRLGRHFWKSGVLILLGRNEKENDKIKEIKEKGDILIEPEFSGPTALIRANNKIEESIIKSAENLIANYSKKRLENQDLRFKKFFS